jgi:hypothetical protein
MEEEITFKKGDYVVLSRVTRKYGCKHGMVVKKITIYTDGTKKYPEAAANSSFAGDINIYSEEGPSRIPISGYIVDALDVLGRPRETVVVTGGILKLKTP